MNWAIPQLHYLIFIIIQIKNLKKCDSQYKTLVYFELYTFTGSSLASQVSALQPHLALTDLRISYIDHSLWTTPQSKISTLNLRSFQIFCSNSLLREILNRGSLWAFLFKFHSENFPVYHWFNNLTLLKET